MLHRPETTYLFSVLYFLLTAQQQTRLATQLHLSLFLYFFVIDSTYWVCFACLFYLCRPSLADQVRVGYFSQDRSSQTDVSEIAQLKEMTVVLQNLVGVCIVFLKIKKKFE